MIIDIKIPSPGESITEVEMLSWLVEDGDIVEKDQELAEVESDKATLPLIAEERGKIKIIAQEGQILPVGAVACTIDTGIKLEIESSQSNRTENIEKSSLIEETNREVKITPLARKLMEENNISFDNIKFRHGRIDVSEVKQAITDKNAIPGIPKIVPSPNVSREYKRIKLSLLRRKLGQRLVAVKNETAMLTTFNEVDMTEVIALRKKYKDEFMNKHGVKLGFMSFFTKAATEALKLFPNVNATIYEDDIIYFNYSDISIAVQTDKGLMVPVLRNTETMNFADIEKNIIALAEKARSQTISIDEMTGGTFTITNGGVFGSMLSTPIINPPQAGILGMHNIVERPVAINGKVEIRPIMYLAFSYDHRIIDGRDSVGFLKTIKELIESPEKMLSEGENLKKTLLHL